MKKLLIKRIIKTLSKKLKTKVFTSNMPYLYNYSTMSLLKVLYKAHNTTQSN